MQVVDQMQRRVEIGFPPKRIISLVPSQTEFLLDIGLADRVVGITRFCIHPQPLVQHITKIGGTKQFNFKQIDALQPDLIIGNKEENYEEGINQLAQHYPVWMSDIFTLIDALAMMQQLGEITGATAQAARITQQINPQFIYAPQPAGATAAYFIWRKPYMVAAGNTFINHMLGALGVRNVFANVQRYPQITTAQLAAANPQFIFLSSEPYRFTQKHIDEFKSICPGAQVLLVDGEIFSWYGSRLRHAATYFAGLRSKLGI